MKHPVNENDTDLWLDQFPVPKSEDNKYTRGSVLIYGGPVMTGASRLAARAAQRMGAGLVTLAASAKAAPLYAEALESIIVHACDGVDIWEELLADPRRNAILIGPGLGLGQLEQELVLASLKTKKLCVLDADALTNFAHDPKILLDHLHAKCVLTPHEGEFERVFASHIDMSLDRILRTQAASERAGCVVLLKGAETVIAAPGEEIIINRNAPPTLATGGSGDVLAGMILGLLAQHMGPLKATAAAAWLHGSIATRFGPGLIAEDLVSGIPEALKSLSINGKRV